MFTFGKAHIIFQRKQRKINQYFFLFYGLIIPLRVPKPPLRNFARLQRGTSLAGQKFRAFGQTKDGLNH